MIACLSFTPPLSHLGCKSSSNLAMGRSLSYRIWAGKQVEADACVHLIGCMESSEVGRMVLVMMRLGCRFIDRDPSWCCSVVYGI